MFGSFPRFLQGFPHNHWAGPQLWESFKAGCNKRGPDGVREASPLSIGAALGLGLQSGWWSWVMWCTHPTHAPLAFSFTSASW